MTTTLLGVDDSKTMRKVLEITFAGEDFRTILAENADDAMSKLHAERPSVVLVDAALDGTSGYDLCQRVKAAAPGTSVVLLSSKHQPYDRNRGLQAGADDFIDKPFDTQQLIDKVVNLLRKGTQAAPQPARAPASSPLNAPVAAAAAPTTARPAPEPIARPRAQTIAYGSHNFAPVGGTSPVAPVVPPANPAVARPAAPPLGAQPSVKPATPAGPPVAPVAAAPAVAAPPPVAAPITAPMPVAPQASAATSNAVAAHTSNGSDLAHKLAGLGLTAEQVAGVLALSRDVVEKVVWEVVPTLAETIIKEEIRRLTSD